jgi:hypothetical protein
MNKQPTNTFLSLLGANQPQGSQEASIDTAAPQPLTSNKRGMGLGNPVFEEPSIDHDGFDKALKYLLSEEHAMKRVLDKYCLDDLLALLVKKHGKKTVRAALGRVRGQRLHVGYIIVRRALACFCEYFGYVGDSAAARQLAPSFTSTRIDTFDQPRAPSLRKLLEAARKHAAHDPMIERLAREQAARWREKHREHDLQSALRSMRRYWKITTPF